MAGTGGPPEPNGWLHTYLEHAFQSIEQRFDRLEGKVDALERRQDIEDGKRAGQASAKNRRTALWERARGWLHVLSGVIAGAIAGWTASHH